MSFSQNYNFGKVSKEELEETFYPTDSSAKAAYLYKNRRTYYQYVEGEGFSLITEIHERIKIYNKGGFNYATKRIGLYTGANAEALSELKAITYNLVGGNILKDKLNKGQLFEVNRSKSYKEQKFTMPNIKTGCIIEYKYIITSPYIYNIQDYVFQHAIPVRKMEAEFSAPEYYVFKINSRGFINIDITKEQEPDEILFTHKTRSGAVSRTEYSYRKLEFTQNISKYSVSNVPALKNEPYVNNIRNYRSSIDYELSFVKMPDSEVKAYSTTWEDVVRKVFESPNFGGQLKKTGYFEKDLKEVIANHNSPKDRAKAIFRFIKRRMKWNRKSSKYTKKGVKKAYESKIGNVSEINLMLTAMLRYANLNANPVLVSTRDYGIPLFPTREGYNYVVTRVKIDNEVILLDATLKYGAFNVLPSRALNWKGRVIRENGDSGLVDLYPKEKSMKSITMNFSLDDMGTIDGAMRTTLTNHKALDFRRRYQKKNEEKFISKMEERYGDMEVLDFNVKNVNDVNKPVIETCKFSLENQADKVGNSLYFSPLLFLRTAKSDFKLEEREFPVDFVYPQFYKFMINIGIPEGYKIESIPKALSIALPDNLGAFTYKVLVNDITIQIIVSSKMNEAIVKANYYKILKDYFSQMIAKQDEQIVLTKKQS